MRASRAVFVDSGAWIALAVSGDPLHARAAETWNRIRVAGHAICTSVPVILETFTFLDRNTRRDVALDWKDSLGEVPGLRTLECRAEDMPGVWKYFERQDLHKLSAVDATSFVLMTRNGIKNAFAFDHHFASAGFRMIG
ncbi:MAG: PIN domain-containing protein [Gammaproteobacteria bacterium]|nr:PIN domain-containing protein [Gammaproteobacteria bacterium]MDE0479261.1 PIN domain-containing protein [Gammaproteobacteria bacterium]MXX06808.1 PIN domain-containing protein [Gammaproteobacteria bacterium]MXY90117.1 PIN domain-containing protein [Gammaproteobacteria bacterium]MXZ33188.1 PIN domain-containing protein [Gammaproteobacteria bacterium]